MKTFVSMAAVMALVSGCPQARADEAALPSALNIQEIIAPTGGVCRAVYVEPGQLVQQGERLVALGPVVELGYMNKLQSDLRNATEQLEAKRNFYLMALQDFQRGSVATSVVEQSRAEMEAAGVAAGESRSRLRETEDTMRSIFLYSPAAAAIKDIEITIDQTIQAGDVLIRLIVDNASEQK